MSSQTRRINPQQPESAIIAKASSLLRQGDLVVAPTETRYGLLAHGDDPRAVSRLYQLKGRPWNIPTALFVPSIEDMSRYGHVSAVAQRLAEQFLPGPLTLVLKAVVDWAAPRVVDGKIGIRVSPAPVVVSLLKEVGAPLTATSANLTGKPDGVTVQEIARALGTGVALYLDGGKLEGPVSTVVDCSTDTLTILRAGAIAEEEIRRVASMVGTV